MHYWSLRQRTPSCSMIEYPDLLAAAIIKQAVVDYKNFPTMRAEIKRFIKSEYFRSFRKVRKRVRKDVTFLTVKL